MVRENRNLRKSAIRLSPEWDHLILDGGAWGIRGRPSRVKGKRSLTSRTDKSVRRTSALNVFLVYRFGRFKSEWLIIYSFLALSLTGALILLLPACTGGRGISVIDALFTSTSAVCVTGLVVVDTGTAFSGLGQGVILVLIQLGGLGIITISTFFAILLGKRMPLRQGEVVRQTHSSIDAASFVAVVRRILFFTFVFEGLGAILLFSRWHTEFAADEAAKLSVFHAVSAFCNAGFSLFHNSLMDYKSDVLVNFVLMTLIFLGGIGFLVIHDLERWIRFRKRLSLHSRLALAVSFVLIVSGAGLFLLFEWRNALTGYSWWERVMLALFQSVTSRTAGFNTVDFSILTNSSLVLLMFLMFVGGSPGSTAGGVKTTTFAVLMATAISRIQGRESTNIWRRTIPEKNVNSMTAIILISISVMFLFYFLLQWTEAGWVPHTLEGHRSLQLAFEAISAFGTVGLSAGITPELTFWGKLQIITLMLVGRIGPLVISVAIARRQTHRAQYEYYRENVMVG